MSQTIKAGALEHAIVKLLTLLDTGSFEGSYRDAASEHGITIEDEWSDGSNPILAAGLIVWNERAGWVPSEIGSVLIQRIETDRVPYSPDVINRVVVYTENDGVIRLGKITGAAGSGSSTSYAIRTGGGHLQRPASEVVVLP